MVNAPSTLTLRLRALALLGLLAFLMYLTGWLLLNPNNLVNQAFRAPITTINSHLMAGPYPTDRDLASLRAQGVTTVVSLLDAKVPYEDQLLAREREAVARHGMKLVNVPMTSFFGHRIGEDYPAAAAAAAAAVRKAPDRVYLHCYLGEHRMRSVLDLLATDQATTVAAGETPRRPAPAGRRTLAQQIAANYDAGEFAAALDLYGTVVRPEPATQLVAAWANFRLNRIDTAETLFHAARDRDPELWDASSGLAYCALRHNQLTAAEGGFQSVLDKHPGDVQAEIGLAVTNAHAGRYDHAAELLQQVLAAHADNDEARELLKTYQSRIASASRR